MTEPPLRQCRRCEAPLGRRAKIYCSVTCASLARQTPEAIAARAQKSREHWADPESRVKHIEALRASHPKKEPFAILCEQCGEKFVSLTPKRFCSRSCATLWVAKQPHVVEARREAMRKHLLDPESKLRSAVMERMTNSNPAKRQVVREKVSAALRGRPAPHLNGGNGRGPTVPQMLMYEILSPLGFDMETGPLLGKGSKSLWPGGLRFDLALKEEKLGIEIDGQSHNTYAVRERDRRKTSIAEERGWRVLRLRNTEVIDNLDRCMETIQSHLSPSKAAELQTQFTTWRSKTLTATMLTDS